MELSCSALSAKHQMSSVSGYLGMETAFIVVLYAIVSPLIAWVYSRESSLYHSTIVFIAANSSMIGLIKEKAP